MSTHRTIGMTPNLASEDPSLVKVIAQSKNINQSVSGSFVGRCFPNSLAKHQTISSQSACLLACVVVVIPSQFSMSFSHLLVGLPLPLLPSTFASSMCFSKDPCHVV